MLLNEKNIIKIRKRGNMFKINQKIVSIVYKRYLMSLFYYPFRRINVERNKLVAGLINRVGVLTTNTFNERLAAQKIIFIAQSKMKNFPIKLRYGLYISGPYSPQLINFFYEIKDTSKYGKVKFKDQREEEQFSKFSDVLRPYIHNRPILELTGTLVYLENKGYSGEDLSRKLREIKPGFSNEQYKRADRLIHSINKIFN
jgi:hypothetical protein